MSKKSKRPVSLGASVAGSIGFTILVAVIYLGIAVLIPTSAEARLVQYVLGNQSPTFGGILWENLWGEISFQQMFYQMPLSMFFGGVLLGKWLGEEYGPRTLYKWAAGCGIGIFLASNIFLWGGKLISQNMHLSSADFTNQIILGNIFAFVLWVGLYLFGAEIGRRFHKQTDSRAVTAS